MMGHKLFPFLALIVLLVGAPGFAQTLPGWEPVNSNGFGDPQTGEVSALGAFNGYLYAGTFNPVDPEPLFDGAQIFRSQDGMAWTAVTQPGFGVAHDIAPPTILDFTVFGGRIYASTGRGDGPGQIWRALDGVNWAPMVIHGFNDPDTVDVAALAEYNGMIYAGARNTVSGAKIWRSFTGDNNTWQPVTALPAPTMAGAGVTSAHCLVGAVFLRQCYFRSAAGAWSEGPVFNQKRLCP